MPARHRVPDENILIGPAGEANRINVRDARALRREPSKFCLQQRGLRRLDARDVFARRLPAAAVVGEITRLQELPPIGVADIEVARDKDRRVRHERAGDKEREP